MLNTPISHPHLALIQKIDSISNNLYILFFELFSGGKTKPTGLQAHQLNLFELMWNEFPSFNEVSAVDIYQETIADKINQAIVKYSEDLPLDKDKLAYTFKNYLEKIFLTRCVLEKQRLYLQELANQPYTNFIPEVQSLSHKEKHINQLVEKLNCCEIEVMLANLQLSFKKIIFELTNAGYGKIENIFNIKFDAKPVALHPRLIQPIQTLPKTNFLNGLIDEFEKGLKASNKEVATLAKNTILNQIKIIEDQKNQFRDEVGKISSHLQTLSQHLTRHVEEIHSLFQAISEDQKNKLKTVRIALKLRGYEQKGETVSKGCRELGFVSAGLNELTKKNLSSILTGKISQKSFLQLINDIDSLEKSIRKLTEPMALQLYILQKISHQVNEAQEQLRHLDHLLILINSLIAKIKSTAIDADSLMTKMQETLQQHALLDNSYLSYFWNQHRLKLLIGGTGGASASTLISLLAIAFNPLATGLLIGTGTVLGTAIGGVTGVITDRVKEKKVDQQEVKSDSEALLLAKEKEEQEKNLDFNFANLKPLESFPGDNAYSPELNFFNPVTRQKSELPLSEYITETETPRFGFK